MAGSGSSELVQVELGTEARVFIEEHLSGNSAVRGLPQGVTGRVFALVPRGTPMENLTDPAMSMLPISSIEGVHETLARTLDQQYGESFEHLYVIQDYYGDADLEHISPWRVIRWQYEGRDRDRAVTRSHDVYVARSSDVRVDSLSAVLRLVSDYANVGGVVQHHQALDPPYDHPVVVITQMFDAETLGWWAADS